MSTEQTPAGIFSFNAQGNTNSPIDVTFQLGKSFEFNELLDKLTTQERLFSLIPENDTDERLTISKKINDLKELIEQFKRDVLQLAQVFRNIEVNTERLNLAKRYFDKGKFGEAREVLENGLEQMRDEQTQLLSERERYKNETMAKLIHNAEEFLILALVTRFDYDNPRRFVNTCSYFELSIRSEITKENLFQYAHFLADNNKFPKAVNYYSQYLSTFSNEISPESKASTLNNLAILHQSQNQYTEAFREYKEALTIYRNLAAINPKAFLPDVAMTLNNLGALHQTQNQYDQALKVYKEALRIRRKLVQSSSEFLHDVATTLNNLAVLHWYKSEFKESFRKYEEALEIRRSLDQNTSNSFLSDIAATLNNLAVLHQSQNEYEEASKRYKEALTIYRSLAKKNPNVFLPDVAMTLNNLAALHHREEKLIEALKEYEEALEIRRTLCEQMPSAYGARLAQTLINMAIFYQDAQSIPEKSIEFGVEAIILLIPLIEIVPYTQVDLKKAVKVLQSWDLSSKEIQKLVSERIKAN